MKVDSKEILGTAICLTAGIFWGISGVFGQYLFTYKNFNSDFLVPIRLIVAGILLLLTAFFKYGKKIFLPLTDIRNLPRFLIYTVFGIMLCQYTYFFTVQLSNASAATVLQYSSPVLVMITVSVMNRKMPKAVNLISVFLAVGGIFLTATKMSFSSLAISKEALIMGLLSALTMVVMNLAPVKLLKKYSTIIITGWAMFFGGLILGIVKQPIKCNPTFDLPSVISFFIVTVIGSAVAYSLYFKSTQMIGVQKASIYACIEPVAAALVAGIWLKTPLTVYDWLGIILIISSVVLLSATDIKNNNLRNLK